MSNNLIYVLKDPSGIVRYVGQTTVGASKRLRSHKKQARDGRKHPVSCFVRKYMDSVTIEVVENCSKDALNIKEVYWIAHYRDLGLTLLNLTDGGGGCSGFKMPRDAAFEARRQAQIGKPNPYKGKKMSSICRANIREVISKIDRTGENNSFFGKFHSEEARSTMGKCKNGQNKGGNNKRSIVCLNTNMVFTSSHDAAERMGLKASSIRSVLQGKAKAIKGYRFKHV